MKSPYATEKKAWARKRAAILRLDAKGVSKAEIGRRYGISRQRVSKIVSDYGSKQNEAPRPD